MDRFAPAAVAAGTLTSESAEATRAIGERLGAAAPPGTVLALVGPLGAGKTQLAKGVAEGLGVRSVVNSPTFVLMNEHVGRVRLFHIDAYRLEDPQEALAAGLLDERGVEGVTVVEWADRLDGWLPPERIDIEIGLDPQVADRRQIDWQAHGAVHAELVRAALETS
jgi:tRNA threonylcarbamoyladenosine biosynthesis protein TsaE